MHPTIRTSGFGRLEQSSPPMNTDAPLSPPMNTDAPLLNTESLWRINSIGYRRDIRIIPESPPAPVKRRPESTISLRSNLQDEPACVRSISLQDQSNPIGPVLGCPGAPTKKRSSRSVLRKSLLDNMDCVRSLRYHDHVLPVRRVTQALAPKKKPLKRTLSLRLNKGILPRPF
ncbi:hypothetical protein RRG08_033610 [Elysia crispata]|uniref:Uncharacterized protein n=1 Tax=Elysia crispata TaxID=231223 RepID=A0AAE0XQV7_9GAST|nr:hypothetical protein RRG08_033610 [Elysia crispata]